MVQHAPHQPVCHLNMKIERSYTAQSCPPHTQIDFNFDGEGIKDGGVAKHRCALKLLPWCYTAILNQCNGWFNHTVSSCASKGLFDWWRIGGQIIVANWPSMGAPWSWDWWQFNLSTMRMDCHVRPSTSKFWSVECISQLFTDVKADLKL